MPCKPSVRTWVDDCSTFAQEEAAAFAMATVAGQTAEQMQLMGLRANTTKSGVVGSRPGLTEAMRQAAGPLFACREPLKDLGVVQGSGHKEGEAAANRWHTACDRLAKIARLSTTTAERGTFAAVAAMTAGVYATSCREQPDRDMEAMRRWVRHAVWHGGPAADYRVLLWPGVVPRRADPVLTVLQAAGRTVSLLLED